MRILICPLIFKLPGMTWAHAISIGRVVIFREAPEPVLLRHEEIHQEQMTRKGVIRFYAHYLCDYVRGRLRGLSHYEAYRSIPAEVEAYARQNEVRS